MKKKTFDFPLGDMFSFHILDNTTKKIAKGS